MKYQLVKGSTQSADTIELTADEFEEISKSKLNLIIALGIEEKFNLVLENYLEFERELLEMVLGRLIFADTSWSGFQNDIYVLNRRLANLLSACRTYIDQLQHDLSQVFGRNSTELASFRDKLEDEKKSTLGFRAMEALRNHAQHFSFPIQSLMFTSTLDETGVNRTVKNTVSPSLSITELKDDRQFDEDLITDLFNSDTEILLTPLVRDNVEALGRIHRVVHSSLDGNLLAWDAVMHNAIQRWKNQFGDEHLGLAAVRVSSDGKDEMIVQVFDEFIERRKFLQKRTSRAANLANQYVSSETDNSM